MLAEAAAEDTTEMVVQLVVQVEVATAQVLAVFLITEDLI
jgi:hypothetical protein